MGLASALSTALTGLNAAETQIDVVGNNLANSQTFGFKQSDVIFANQFLQTQGRGSAPSAATGGTNPRQTGLGVLTSEITPDFTQGTIEISSNPSDLAIQGDGFFLVQGTQGEQLYTRNGVFKTNSANELVTTTGQRLLGYTVDEFYNIQTTQLVPLEVPLGSAAVAEATSNVSLTGTLRPDGDIATTAAVIESATLGDSLLPRPEIDDPAQPLLASVAPIPNAAGTSAASGAGATTFTAGDQYQYVFAFVDSNGNESVRSSTAVLANVGANGDEITLSNIPPSPAHGSGVGFEYDTVNIYRRKVGVADGDPEFDYRLLGSTAQGAAAFVDDNSVPLGAALNTATIDGNYSYVVTFGGAGLSESRPSALRGPVNVVNGRIHIDDLPSIPVGPGIPPYDTINIYRNLANNSEAYYRVAAVGPGEDFTDSRSDAELLADNIPLDFDGPKITAATLLVNVLKRDGLNYENLFEEGSLRFTSLKGGKLQEPSEFTIDSGTTVQDLIEFMEKAMGIQRSASGVLNPIPGSENHTGSGGAELTPGGMVTSDGKIRFVSNNGVGNALDIRNSAFQLTDTGQQVSNPTLSFGTVQQAVGESATVNFQVFDSLGIPLNVRVTAVLETRNGSSTTYRWFADSADNDPLGPNANIAVGTGLVTFDGDGNFIAATNSTVAIERRDVPSNSPLEFQLDFSNVTGLSAGASSNLQAPLIDGSSAGKLTSFIVGEDGVVRGVFSNGVTRDLGQVVLARFANPAGLEQMGLNLWAQGVNSGLPVIGNPGQDGIGTVVAGAVELSNTDIGQNLIDLVLATTMYRGNSRVISTAQQLLDVLLSLRQ